MLVKAALIALVALVISAGAAFVSPGVARTQAPATPVCNSQWQLVQSAEHSPTSGEIDSLNSVAALSSGDQWAVGSWLHYPDAYTFHTLVEHWDGSSAGWTVVPSPNPLVLNSYFYDVAALGPNDAWAVGGTDQSGPLTTAWSSTGMDRLGRSCSRLRFRECCTAWLRSAPTTSGPSERRTIQGAA